MTEAPTLRPVDWQEAELFTGQRLDRRRSYAIGPGSLDDETPILLELGRWTDSCSGCVELGDYGSGSHLYETDAKHGCLVGGGCHECGHTGKRRTVMWLPAELNQEPSA